MRKTQLVSLLVLIATTLSAQTMAFDWVRQMGGTSFNNGSSIVLDAAGNVYTTGSFQGTADFDPGVGVFNLTAVGAGDVFISKLDAAGNFIWAKQMGGMTVDEGRSITVDAVGNVYTTGHFTGTADFDPGTSSYNLTAVADMDIFISKLDPMGNFVWAKQMGASSFDIGQAIEVDAVGNVYTTGFFYNTVDFDPGVGTYNLSATSGHDMFILKLNTTGDFVWARQMGGSTVHFGLDLKVDASGNIYSTGHFRETVDFDPGIGVYNLTSAGEQDVFVHKLDPSGNFVWTKQFEGTGNDGGQSLAVDASGNVYTTGYFQGTADFDPGTGVFDFTSVGDADIFVSKLDPSGDFVWAKQLSGSSFAVGSAITVGTTGDVYVSGAFMDTVDFDAGTGTFNLTSTGGIDVFIHKMDGAGGFEWAMQMGSTDFDEALSIAVDAAGQVYTTGYFQGTVDFDPGTGTANMTSVGTRDIFIHKMSAMPVAVAENIELERVKVYPNPSRGEVTVDLSGINDALIRVMTTTGRVIYENKAKNDTDRFEINGAPGMYYVQIVTPSSKKIFKLVKR